MGQKLTTIAGAAAAAGMGALSRAAAKLSRSLNLATKATLTNEDTGDEIEVMFNPTELGYSMTAETDSSVDVDDDDDDDDDGTTKKKKKKKNKVTDNENVYYRQTTVGNLKLDLFIDTYEESSLFGGQESAKDHVDEFMDLVMPTVSEGNAKRIPYCKFEWGEFEYRGIVKEVDHTYTMFVSDGTPVRAKIGITMQRVFEEGEGGDYTNIGASRKFWTVRHHDRLDLIAYKMYKKPELWTIIAEANGIENPLHFPGINHIGKELIIPHLD